MLETIDQLAIVSFICPIYSLFFLSLSQNAVITSKNVQKIHILDMFIQWTKARFSRFFVYNSPFIYSFTGLMNVRFVSLNTNGKWQSEKESFVLLPSERNSLPQFLSLLFIHHVQYMAIWFRSSANPCIVKWQAQARVTIQAIRNFAF